MKGFFVAILYAVLSGCSFLYAGYDILWHTTVGADYIFWTARENGLMTAVGNIADFPTTSNRRSDVLYPRWRVRSGFKVSAGLASFEARAEFLACYTYFHNRGNPLLEVNCPNGQVPSYFGAIVIDTFFPNQVDRVTKVFSSWNDTLDRLDIRFYKIFGKTDILLVRPFMGLVVAWHEQWLSLRYISLDTDLISDSEINVYTHQWLWCYGPSSGMDLELLIFENPIGKWGVFAEKALSIAWYEPVAIVKTTRKNDKVFAPRAQNTKNVFYSMFPILDLKFGMRCSLGLENRPIIVLEVAWQLSAWFDQNHMFSNFIFRGSGVCDSLYTLQGLCIKGAVYF